LTKHLNAKSIHLLLNSGEQLSELGEISWSAPLIGARNPSQNHGEMRPDPDAALYGIQEAVDERGICLKVPLFFGTARVGYIIAQWEKSVNVLCEDWRMTRAMWVGAGTLSNSVSPIQQRRTCNDD
jgi:hypothetical protein